MGSFSHTVFMSPKVDYVLIISLFVCLLFAVAFCDGATPYEVIGYVMELFGGGQFFLLWSFTCLRLQRSIGKERCVWHK